MDGVVSKQKKFKHNSNINQGVQRTSDFSEQESDYQVCELGVHYDAVNFEQRKKSNIERLYDFEDNELGEASYTSQKKSNLEEEMVIEEEKAIDDFFERTEKEDNERYFESEDKDDSEEDVTFSLSDLPIFAQNSVIMSKYISSRFAVVAVVFVFILSSFLFVGTSWAVKNRVDGAGKRAINSIKVAAEGLSVSDFDRSGEELKNAHQEFVVASEEMNKIGGFATFISQFIPGASKLSSGNHIIEAGKYLTHSATEFHSVIPEVIGSDNPLVSVDGAHISFLKLYTMLADAMEIANEDVSKANEHISRVHLDDVPSEYRETFVQMKETLPSVVESLNETVEARSTIETLLGANGPRTYLFLFQNNHEMRATGGFIGSYGILKIKDGQIEKIVVDDIFNPDGQLMDRVVPPLPIQKISANWSMHDSNWFVDFPLSAKKAMDFYERAGGPTVDGVITITPAMMQKFLDITGPIALPQYEMVLTSDNFMEVMQDEVEDEENYELGNKSEQKTQKEKVDKKSVSEEDEELEEETQKQPKKVLSDLMPVLVEKLSNRKNPRNLSKLIGSVSEGLKERHIMMYMSDEDVQSIIEEKGWSGSILQTDKDYLSVINTNVNGFKTDGVIDETIKHKAEIDGYGYIVNTVQVQRVHKGGKTGFPWWDAVNSNYMRVYVPEGSELISVEGHTREINEERLKYDELGYERDVDVEREENNIKIDEETGTRIYDEYGKTVFANWVYVSPQESVTVTYKYRLPFRVDFESDDSGKFGSYAILFQKQSGSERSVVESEIELSESFAEVWNSSAEEIMKNDLKMDRYHGLVFREQ